MANTVSSTSGQTGARCTRSGPYQSTSKSRLILFIQAGNTFPTDWDGSSTTWVLMSGGGS